MKSLCNSSPKLAALAVLVVLALAGTASAQGARIQTSHLDALAAKASQTVDVNLDERLMQLTARLLDSKDEDDAKVKEIISGLKGVYVRNFSFETEGQYTAADIEPILTQLRGPNWNRVVNVKSKKEGNVEVYLMLEGNQVGGLALLAMDPKEVTVINIVGDVDLKKLSSLEGKFGIPELDIERQKVKSKNE